MDTANSECERQADPAGESRTVTLPAGLVARVEDRLGHTQYGTAGEYVAFVLEETLARVEAETDDEPAAVDESEVQERLESLGYLDS